MKTNIDAIDTLTEQINTARSQLSPALARVVIDAVKNEAPTNELLSAIGVITGQGISAIDLLVAIRNELNAK